MKTSVVFTDSSTTAADAAKSMIENEVGSLPVTQDSNIVGMVTRTDLLRTIKV
jgi:CBS domain-containing protein